MKRCTFAVTLVAFVLLYSYLWAAPPVCPPFEGFLIETSTSMTVYGNASEEENFDWHWNNDECTGATNGIDNGLQANESVARITYKENFDSFNAYGGSADLGKGLRGEPLPEEPPTTYYKEFSANSHPDGTANLTVEKDIGYTSDGQAGHHADFEEITSVEVVSAGGVFEAGSMFEGVLALCPWAPTPTDELWPATNEGIAMGSAFAIPATLLNGDPGYIDFASDTDAGVTKGVALNYDVTATGKGVIQAEMIARIWEGSTIQSQKDPGATPLNSVSKYTEKAKADGIFGSFHRGMLYRAKFELPDITSIGLGILQ